MAKRNSFRKPPSDVGNAPESLAAAAAARLLDLEGSTKGFKVPASKSTLSKTTVVGTPNKGKKKLPIGGAW